ncbi:hypothetical protein L209DRAFT_264116 [Thermothelomyces heterothallicus CBS 203.75]
MVPSLGCHEHEASSERLSGGMSGVGVLLSRHVFRVEHHGGIMTAMLSGYLQFSFSVLSYFKINSFAAWL